MSRPSGFTQDIADRICERLADGESLRTICEADDMPGRATVFRWLGAHPEFRDQYACAREAQADAIFDDMLDIADDGRNDWMEKRNSDGEAIGWRENGEVTRRSALRVEARKWVLGKMQPKRFSDRLAVDHSGKVEVDTRPDFSSLSPVERDALKTLLLTAEMRSAKAAEGEPKP